nr:hypothetical protein [Tanacetum cinerariifolium]
GDSQAEEEGQEVRKEKKIKVFGVQEAKKVGTSHRVESSADTVVDVEEPKKKRVTKETLLQESFKKLKVVSGSKSTQEIPSNDPKVMSEEDVQNMLEIILVSEFKVEALQVKHDMFMLTEKDYPLSNGVMTFILSAKLQVEEDSEMAGDLVMKIFMEANKPKSISLDTSSK